MTVSGLSSGESSDITVTASQDAYTTSHVYATGFKPGTRVTVWVFSTPVKVAQPQVRADRSAESQFMLPAQIQPGQHMLLAAGTSATGASVTMKIGFVVSAPDGSASGRPSRILLPARLAAPPSR